MRSLSIPWTRLYPLGVCLLVAASGCGDTAVTELSGPTDARCPIALGALPQFGFAGGEANTSVSAARECSWTISADASWVQVTPATGQGGTLVTLRVRENAEYSTRAATLLLNGQRVTLIQEAAPPPPPPPDPPDEAPDEGGPEPPSTARPPEIAPPPPTARPLPDGPGTCISGDGKGDDRKGNDGGEKGGGKGSGNDEDNSGNTDGDTDCQERN